MSANFQLPAYGWTPRKDQVALWRQMISPDFRKGVIVAHRRFGKDELGLHITAAKAMSRVGSYWYCLPEYEQARKAIWNMVNWRTKRTRIDDAFPPEIVAKRDDRSMMLWLESGSTVQIIGADQVDSLVGGGQIGIVLSEASLCNPNASPFFAPILEESGGWELQIGTPRGKNHFYKHYLAAKEDQDAGDHSVMAALVKAHSTAVYSPDQLQRIRRDLERTKGKKMGEALFAQEYECSFNAAIVGAVWGEELSDLELEGRYGDYKYDRRFPVLTSWDIGVGDATVILFWQEIRGQSRLIDAFEATGIGLDSYINVLKEKNQTKGYIYSKHLAPHDIQQREWIRGVSRLEEARRMGLNFERIPNTSIKTQVAVAAQFISVMEVASGVPEVAAAFEHLKAYRYPVSQTGAIITTPVHDEHSHTSSALMTYALYQTSKLGFSIPDEDDSLHGSGSLGADNFDPRVYDTRGVFASGNQQGAGLQSRFRAAPKRGAFG